MAQKKFISTLIGNILQQVFIRTTGSWGAGVILDENGNIVDDEYFCKDEMYTDGEEKYQDHL